MYAPRFPRVLQVHLRPKKPLNPEISQTPYQTHNPGSGTCPQRKLHLVVVEIAGVRPVSFVGDAAVVPHEACGHSLHQTHKTRAKKMSQLVLEAAGN